jgi:Mg2+ and Co2+ transporter CorA
MQSDVGTGRLYDDHGGVQTIDLDDTRISKRDESQLVWIDLVVVDSEALERSAAALGVQADELRQLLKRADDGTVDDQGDTLGIHAFTLVRTDETYERQSLDVAAGSNWVVTLHDGDNRTIDEFEQRLQTSRRVGALDGGSFVAFLLDWLLTRYMAEIDELDGAVDELDLAILHSSGGDESLADIAEMRMRAATIRRALAAHRDIVTWPAHTEFSDVMTETAQRHFAAVGERFAQAMDSADRTRDSLAGTFDLLMSRVAQRTNDTVRILTVVSVSLLPATLLAGIMGMNFHPAFFDRPNYFWVMLGTIGLMVVIALITARRRNWM